MRAGRRVPGIALLLGLAGAGAARAQTFQSDSAFGRWMAYYYTQPQPQRLVASFFYYCGSRAFAHESGRVPMAAFYASTIGSDAALLQRLFDSVAASADPDVHKLGLLVLWLSRLPQARGLIQRAPAAWKDTALAQYARRIMTFPATAYGEIEVTEPGDLDVLWAMFFATGNVGPVEQIAATVDWVQSDNRAQALIGLAARWSLASNAAQHPRVMAILRDLRSGSGGRHAAVLDSVLAAARTQPNPPRRP